MTSTLNHAKRELALLGYTPPAELEDGDINKSAQESILELLEVFVKQGHSGFSAQYVLGMFFKLANHSPLKPLTGEDSEWDKVDFQTYQNNRCDRVFKLTDGRVFDVEGFIFEEPDGARFTNSDSRVYITFPYMPTTEIVKVVKTEIPEELPLDEIETTGE